MTTLKEECLVRNISNNIINNSIDTREIYTNDKNTQHNLSLHRSYFDCIIIIIQRILKNSIANIWFSFISSQKWDRSSKIMPINSRLSWITRWLKEMRCGSSSTAPTQRYSYAGPLCQVPFWSYTYEVQRSMQYEAKIHMWVNCLRAANNASRIPLCRFRWTYWIVWSILS